MTVLTIGAFAQLSGLTPKALRLYDDLGLLPPARVDPESGYRYYGLDQLTEARKVAWLRRLGMPLARIRQLRGLAPAAAAAGIAAYWAECEADHAVRRDLAAALVSELSGEETGMTAAEGMEIRYAAGTDAGLVRARNEDAACAGPRLLAVADGFGPGGGGDLAAAAAVSALAELAAAGGQAGDPLAALRGAAQRVNGALPGLAAADPSVAGLGTTLTALLWSGSQLALVHIGDSRAYLLRDGEMFQITHDHSYVQRLVDEGRLEPAEAASHPDRMLLVRALDGKAASVPDTAVRQARPGDRYLLCTDGLSRVVPGETIRDTLRAAPGPEEAVAELIGLARAAGGPDNIACAVADVPGRAG
jgi:serine/threonine protein phosphatase PrpC